MLTLALFACAADQRMPSGSETSPTFPRTTETEVASTVVLATEPEPTTTPATQASTTSEGSGGHDGPTASTTSGVSGGHDGSASDPTAIEPSTMAMSGTGGCALDSFDPSQWPEDFVDPCDALTTVEACIAAGCTHFPSSQKMIVDWGRCECVEGPWAGHCFAGTNGQDQNVVSSYYRVVDGVAEVLVTSVLMAPTPTGWHWCGEPGAPSICLCPCFNLSGGCYL